MKIGQTITKAPNDVLDYTFKWKTWLDKMSDTISSSTVTLETGITLDSDTNDTESATMWASGGSDGCTYKATNKIVTAGARTKEAHFYIKIVDPDSQPKDDYGRS